MLEQEEVDNVRTPVPKVAFHMFTSVKNSITYFETDVFDAAPDLPMTVNELFAR